MLIKLFLIHFKFDLQFCTGLYLDALIIEILLPLHFDSIPFEVRPRSRAGLERICFMPTEDIDLPRPPRGAFLILLRDPAPPPPSRWDTS